MQICQQAEQSAAEINTQFWSDYDMASLLADICYYIDKFPYINPFILTSRYFEQHFYENSWQNHQTLFYPIINSFLQMCVYHRPDRKKVIQLDKHCRYQLYDATAKLYATQPEQVFHTIHAIPNKDPQLLCGLAPNYEVEHTMSRSKKLVERLHAYNEARKQTKKQAKQQEKLIDSFLDSTQRLSEGSYPFVSHFNQIFDRLHALNEQKAASLDLVILGTAPACSAQPTPLHRAAILL